MTTLSTDGDGVVKAVAYEISLYLGETPWAVDNGGGCERWEEWKQLASAILALPALSRTQKAEPSEEAFDKAAFLASDDSLPSRFGTIGHVHPAGLNPATASAAAPQAQSEPVDRTELIERLKALRETLPPEGYGRVTCTLAMFAIAEPPDASPQPQPVAQPGIIAYLTDKGGLTKSSDEAEYWRSCGFTITPLVAAGAQPVAIKPLEWLDDQGNDKDFHAIHAQPPLAYYAIWWRGSGPYWFKQSGLLQVQYNTLNAAKAAAQADYETRIRTALATPPAQGDMVLSEWQPIETAPKAPLAEGWACGVDIYLRPSWGGWTVGRWVIEPSHDDGGWFEFLGEDGPQDEQPTAWLPLPAPPLAASPHTPSEER